MTVTELTFEIDGMHCGSCGLLIDDALEELADVTASTTNLRTRTTTVQTTDADTDPQEIITAIAELGYHARHLTG